MNLVLKSPFEATYVAGRDFSVVIAFDDYALAERAMDVLHLLRRNLKKEDGRLFHQWWNIETLAFSSLRELAATEAATADMIILSLRAGEELPGMVAVWIKRLADLCQDRPGALLAMLDSDPQATDAPERMMSELKQLAASGRMDFLAIQAKEGRDQGMARRASAAARQFVMARKNGALNGLPGGRQVAGKTGDLQEQGSQNQLLMNAMHQQRSGLDHDEIARLAFHIWQEDGCQSGRDQDHWLQAEQLLVISRKLK